MSESASSPACLASHTRTPSSGSNSWPTISSSISRLPASTIARSIASPRNTLGVPTEAVNAALRFAGQTLVPALERVSDEIDHVLDGLGGRFVPAGPSGAPTRGIAHVLPTGRNFYAVDPRAVPSQAAWRVGEQLAHEVLARHQAEEGRYPEMIGIGVWGTSQMRTQGDDVAEVLALLGVEPVWDPQTRRIQDLAVVPLERLGRPRIDVTMRISGFFRDAFPHLISLVDRAVEMVVSLDEPADQNYPRKHYLAEIERPTSASTRRRRGARAISDLRREARHLWRRHSAADRDAAIGRAIRTSRRCSSNGEGTPTGAVPTAPTRATSSSIGCARSKWRFTIRTIASTTSSIPTTTTSFTAG